MNLTWNPYMSRGHVFDRLAFQIDKQMYGVSEVELPFASTLNSVQTFHVKLIINKLETYYCL